MSFIATVNLTASAMASAIPAFKLGVYKNGVAVSEVYVNGTEISTPPVLVWYETLSFLAGSDLAGNETFELRATWLGASTDSFTFVGNLSVVYQEI